MRDGCTTDGRAPLPALMQGFHLCFQVHFISQLQHVILLGEIPHSYLGGEQD